MKKIRLLYFDFNLPYLIKDRDHPVGGGTIEWYAWIKGLIINEVQIGVLSWKGANDYIGSSLEFDIVESYDLKEGIPKIRWIYKRYPSLKNAVRNYGPDYLIQESAGFATGVLGYIGKKLNLPFIYRAGSDVEADDRYKKKLTLVQQIAFRYGLSRANVIFCQNSYQYDRFKARFPQKKVIKIYNPYYCEKKLVDLPNNNKRKYIAWIGRFRDPKNLPGLLEIVKTLPNVEFKIAGKVGGILEYDTKIALEQLRKYKNVNFVGYLSRKEIFHFLSNSYALLNTSHHEGFSNTFLEAFAAGTPIVTTVGVDPDSIIANNHLGIVKKKYSELPDAIMEIINSKNFNIISRRCRDYLMQNHNPVILAKKFIENLPIS